MADLGESPKRDAANRRRGAFTLRGPVGVSMLVAVVAGISVAAYMLARGRGRDDSTTRARAEKRDAGHPDARTDAPETAKADIQEAKLVRTFAFDGFRADEVYPADIDGDGRMEFLFLQSPGIYQSKVFADTKYAIPEAERNIYCLTAVNEVGGKLWQVGTPWLDSLRYGSHVADQMVWAGLEAGSAPMQVAAIRGDVLSVLDAATGRKLRSGKLGRDNYTIVRAIRSKDGARLLIKNTDKEYGDHWYADPAHLFDASLRRRATMARSVGSGHSPRAFDLDGDGDDEILIGYDAYDQKGNRRWRLEGRGEDDYEPMGNHVDQQQVGRIGPDGAIRIVYAGSSHAMIGTADGHLVFEGDFGHPQHVVLGDFRLGSKRARIAIFSVTVGEAQLTFAATAGIEVPENKKRRHNIAWLDNRGTIVGLVFPEVAWPGSPARTAAIHSGEGVLVYPEGCPDGGDAVITRDWGWPQALDMSGQHCFAVPFVGEQRSGDADPIGPDGYGLRIADLDGDGRAEILVHDRTTAWIFAPPLPARVPNRQGSLVPVTGQGGYAF